MKRAPLLLAAGLGLLAPAGCGGPASPVPVTGNVRWHGKPLPGGLVVFAPDAARGCTGPLALGPVKPDGTYELATESGAGVPPGLYRVTVSGPGLAGDLDPAEWAALPPLPARYRHSELSGLRAEVRAGPAVVLDWDLADLP